MQLTIDGKVVQAHAGESVLQCALRHLIQIPHLCTHPSLPAFGACRLCIVEIDGMRGLPASCAVPAAEGMVVRTNTPALRDLRRRILELILLEHPSACMVCAKHDLCEQYRPHASKAGRTTSCHTCNNKEGCQVRVLAEDLNLTELPVPPIYRGLPLERSDAFIDRDLNLCILCGRCVRICTAHHGHASIAFIGRGSRTRIGEAFGRSLHEAGCRFCGSCIDVCPTGSLSDRYAKWHGAAATYTATTCTVCDAGCAITVQTSRHRRAVMTRAIDTRVPLCVLGRFAIPEFLNSSRRLRMPHVRVGAGLREVSWSEALAQAAARLRPFVGGGFALVCDTTSTIEDRHVFRRFTREVMGSTHYLELQPDASGRARGGLPDTVRAALLTGDFVDSARLQRLEFLIVQDCYPTAASERVDVSLPAAVLAEVAGTWIDGTGSVRPVRKACEGPGQSKPDWQIVCDLARAMGAVGFEYRSAADMAMEIGRGHAHLQLRRPAPPLAATDPAHRRTHFRGHRLEDTVRGLRALAAPALVSIAVAAGG